jgi:hypothetical protein
MLSGYKRSMPGRSGNCPTVGSHSESSVRYWPSNDWSILTEASLRVQGASDGGLPSHFVRVGLTLASAQLRSLRVAAFFALPASSSRESQFNFDRGHSTKVTQSAQTGKRIRGSLADDPGRLNASSLQKPRRTG